MSSIVRVHTSIENFHSYCNSFSASTLYALFRDSCFTLSLDDRTYTLPRLAGSYFMKDAGFVHISVETTRLPRNSQYKFYLSDAKPATFVMLKLLLDTYAYLEKNELTFDVNKYVYVCACDDVPFNVALGSKHYNIIFGSFYPLPHLKIPFADTGNKIYVETPWPDVIPNAKVVKKYAELDTYRVLGEYCLKNASFKVTVSTESTSSGWFLIHYLFTEGIIHPVSLPKTFPASPADLCPLKSKCKCIPGCPFAADCPYSTNPVSQDVHANAVLSLLSLSPKIYTKFSQFLKDSKLPSFLPNASPST